MDSPKQRDGLFALLVVIILLTGALSAGVAAWVTVAPRTGRLQSSGVVDIPTVLGQTADEVLFYPWPMYDTEQRSSLFGPQREMDSSFLDVWLNLVLNPLQTIEPELSVLNRTQLLQAMEGNVNADGTMGNHLYLRDFPCLLADGAQLTLNYAMSPGSVSFVLQPSERLELSQERQDSALEQVKRDLKIFLLGVHESDGLAQKLDKLRAVLFTTGFDSEIVMFLLMDMGIVEMEAGWAQDEISMDELERQELEALIQELEAVSGWSVQLVATPQQVVILISNGGTVIGIYYDIQMERYSGYGLQSG